MSINKYINKRIIYFACTLVFVLIITISSSFAFSNNDYKKIITNDLVVNYGEEKITSISKINNINIKNISNERRKFVVYAKLSEDVDSLGIDKIYYSINDGYSLLLSEAYNNVIYSGYLDSKESIDLKINMWINKELLTNDDQGKKIIIDYDVQ